MDDIEIPENVVIPPDKTSSSIVPDVPGKITTIIGSAKHAPFSIVYSVIVWSFIVASAISLIIFSLTVFNGVKVLPLDEIKGTWAIFIPVITLALGYIFGKSGV